MTAGADRAVNVFNNYGRRAQAHAGARIAAQAEREGPHESSCHLTHNLLTITTCCGKKTTRTLRDGFGRLIRTTDVAAVVETCLDLHCSLWYDVIMPYMPLAAGNRDRVTVVPQHPTGSVLPQRNLDQISATSGSFVRLKVPWR